MMLFEYKYAIQTEGLSSFSFFFNTQFDEQRFHPGISVVQFNKHKGTIHIKIPLTDNPISEVVWPNREGEVFKVEDINEKISAYKLQKKQLEISYPGSAFGRYFLFKLAFGKEHVLLFSPPDFTGKITSISVHVDESKKSFILINTKSTQWWLTSVEMTDLANRIKHIFTTYNLRRISNYSNVGCRKMFEVGLIDPHGKTRVPCSKGFNVLGDIASLLRKEMGAGNLIHIFGYAQGHDRGYPDYNPSELLGGTKVLKSAIEEIHKQKQTVSVYLNTRLASKEYIRRNPKLRNAILTDENGNPKIQLHPIMNGYKSNAFYIMNPMDPQWIELLRENVLRMKKIGVDCIQLDHLGGREAIGNPGSEWGGRFIDFTDEIISLGMKIWMQGVSDIYNVSSFEMTFRYPYVLENGIVRGGAPLGKCDPGLCMAFFPENEFIVPTHKMDIIAKYKNGNFIECIKNVSENPEGLALYNKDFLPDLLTLLNS